MFEKGLSDEWWRDENWIISNVNNNDDLKELNYFN